MVLSAYGENRFPAIMRDLAAFHPGSGPRLNVDCFNHHRDMTTFETIVDEEVALRRLWGPKCERVLGPARKGGVEFSDRERGFAASLLNGAAYQSYWEGRVRRSRNRGGSEEQRAAMHEDGADRPPPRGRRSAHEGEDHRLVQWAREEDMPAVFEVSHPLPFMIVVYKVRPECGLQLPVTTHEDGTGSDREL